MKLLQTTILLLFLAQLSFGQGPVKWTFSSKKLSDTKYEIHLTAAIQKGWHVYSHKQPAEAIAVPTSIRFQSNPLIELYGNFKEEGLLEKVKEETLGIEAYQYSNRLNYVQVVTLKTNKAKTALNGTLEFQACTDEKCLPPETIAFRILMN